MDGIGTDITGQDLLERESSGTIRNSGVDRVVPGVAAPDVPKAGAFLPALNAAHNRYNAFISVPRYIHAELSAMDQVAESEDYNPFDGLDEGYAPFYSLLADVRSPEERAVMLQYIDMKKEEKLVANSNVPANLLGTLAGAVATTIPTLPIGELMWGATSIPGLAWRGAVVGAAVDVPIEAALMVTDPEFHLDEAWTGVAFSAIAGAIIEPFVVGAKAVKATSTVEGSSGTIKPPSAQPIPTVLAKEAKIAVQVAEDAFKPAVRLTKSGEVTPDEYLKARELEGIAPAPGLIGKAFNAMTKTEMVNWQPNITARLLNSESAVVREITNNLLEHDFKLNKNAIGKTNSISAEAQIELNTAKKYSALEEALDTGFVDYKKAGGKGTLGEFEELVAKAARRGNYTEAGVGRAAQVWDNLMTDYLSQYKAAGLLKEIGLELAEGSKYFTRIYDRDAIIENISAFRQTIADHITPAIRKEMIAEEGVTEAMIKAEVDRAVEEIRSTIMGNSYFDMEHLTWSDKNGKARTIDIPDIVLEPYLKNNVRDIGRMYITRAEKDLALTQRFGSANKTKILENVVEDYKGLLAKETSSQRVAALEARLKADLEHLEAVIDRLMGTRGRPKDPLSLSSKATSTVLAYNMSRGLGGIAITQLPELSRAAMQKYIVSSGVLQELKNIGVVIDKMKFSKQDLRTISALLEDDIRFRQMLQGEPLLHDSLRPESMAEKASRMAGQATAKFSGMMFMDNLTRSMLAHAGMDQVMGHVEAGVKGKLSAKGRDFLIRHGIPEQDIPAIKELYAKHKTVEDGVTSPNLAKWEGPVGDRVRAALSKYHRNHVVRAGAGDRALFSDANAMARLAMQFRSYFQAAWSRSLLPGMQRQDAAFVGSMVAMLMAGYVVMNIKKKLAGHDEKMTNTQIVTETINASGALPFIFDMYATGSNVFFGGGTKRQQAQGRLDTLFGPTAGLIQNGVPAAYRLLSNDLMPGDVRQLKGLVPLNNLIWWNWYATELQKQKAEEIRRARKFEQIKQGE